MTSSQLRYSFLIVLGLGLTQVYQNCGGQFGSFQTLPIEESLSLGSSDGNHPSPASATLPAQKVQVVNRRYVAALMREIFTSTANPVPNLEYFINQWVYFRGAQYGQGCNPYSTYSAVDCGGDVSNSNLPFQSEDNAVRESFHVQFCENVLGMDVAVLALMEKFPHAAAPNAEGIKGMYGLFYRGDEASDEIIATLIELDRTLAANSENAINRWRALALQVCESPGWQLQ